MDPDAGKDTILVNDPGHYFASVNIRTSSELSPDRFIREIVVDGINVFKRISFSSSELNYPKIVFQAYTRPLNAAFHIPSISIIRYKE